MTRHNPYYGYNAYGHSQSGDVSREPVYRQQNSKTHFVMGLAAGAAVAYLLSNKKFREGMATTGEKAWSAVRGEVEELKERLEDTQAELEYYRNLHKGDK
ncbi:YtxH domain-containing protein [Endozoicomonas acroporae]|uniref:YtxH domain-containing protein n=1 Tax=Endozoicomonas acroporae TaxID=1701104 RepID=UPI0013D26691|nr:YtxH domain-containing protein [Endozoicomonas acroporae]